MIGTQTTDKQNAMNETSPVCKTFNKNDSAKEFVPTANLDDVSEYQDLFEEFGASFVPKEKSLKSLIHDMCVEEESEDAFYIVDLSKVVRQMLQWKAYLPRVTPFYAIKCNPSPAIMRIVEAMGGGFDCASKQEIGAAALLLKGENDKRIIYANPCKLPSHMRYARGAGVEMVTVDNEDELHKIKKHWPDAKVIIRIVTDDSHSVCRFSSKFGAQIKDCNHLVSVCRELDLNLTGISFHVGSGCFNEIAFVQAITCAREVFDIAERHGFKLSLLDIGGGFPGITEEGKPSFIQIANAIRDLLDELFPVDQVQIIAEPGRYYACASHTLVTHIFARRKVHKINPEDDGSDYLYYINDGVYQSFNCLLFDHAEIKSVRSIDMSEDFEDGTGNEQTGPKLKSTIFGPTCDSMDCIVKGIDLPVLDLGDVLYFPDFGAYTVAASSAFNGFKTVIMKYIWKN
ncbi:ornithine decarboxylase [Acrasis kona]|uniref:ornithine decarboxylase n=1 Tax=Acrasis kona TaxID=1008807 RepID=A0AAW2YJR8_9EUKA